MKKSEIRIILHLTFRVDKDHQARIVDFVRSATQFYERPGGIHVRLLQSAEEPDLFVEIIEYDNWDKYHEDAARLNSDATMKSYIEEWRTLLLEAPRVETFTELTLRNH
jgi:quinol monooxygenase YgiN